ncbi:MAG: alpha-glucan family phosphorylase [Halothiobacillaceae bacterium]
MTGSIFNLEVRPTLPPQLARLEDFSNNLYYSWNRQIRFLFQRLDGQLWPKCKDNPKVFLRRVSQERLDAAARDKVFLMDYKEACYLFDEYMEGGLHADLAQAIDEQQDVIAYFCAEYGFHESFPIYSGGLGILAGDHCKAASDLGLPFVAVGLLYKQGYFTQVLDGQGNQIAEYHDISVEDLPIAPANDRSGKQLVITLDFPGRPVHAQVWKARVGRVTLYLLDTNVPENSERDRAITYQLYGGDRVTRIEQEIVLGVGGVRALRELGIKPAVWHINEGHAAFMVLERVRELVQSGMTFETAWELTASGTVFTTHTPVPAGHDMFEFGLMDNYFGGFHPALGIDRDRFMALGRYPGDGHNFNMTVLALNGSRRHNGVSRIHGRVASEMERAIWPDVPPDENPMHYVTNGVHVPTFLAREFASLLDRRFRDWTKHIREEEYWNSLIDDVPDHRFWSMRQAIKLEMVDDIKRRMTWQLRSEGLSETRIKRTLRYISDPEQDVLIVGFARRFATYKRANLLFRDREKLRELVNDSERPVVFVFAGKAHPADTPGQQLIREIWQISNEPEFHGRILMIEGYDMALARKLVSGCDVWLNNPEYPLEASGTSGQKAGLNGVINLSVLDGWWGEGYNGENGWAIVPYSREYDKKYRDDEEARDLLHILKEEVVPLYFQRNRSGFSSGWVRKSKESMRTILPQFNSERMVCDYVRTAYLPAIRKHRELSSESARYAAELAEFRRKAKELWPGVSAQRVDTETDHIGAGKQFGIGVDVKLNGMDPEMITVECQFGYLDELKRFILHARFTLEPDGEAVEDTQRYCLALIPPMPGMQQYRIRYFPAHPRQSHPYELGLMRWL